MTSGILCLVGAVICFGMFFGFGPTPENQMTAVFGLVCLFCAFVCFDSAPKRKPPPR